MHVLVQQAGTVAPPRQNDNAKFRARLGLEGLETREVPASVVVTALDDNVNGDATTSLREAIQQMNAQAPGVQHTITFAPNLNGGTITLNSQLDALQKNIYIAGPGSSDLTITRNAGIGLFRLFEVNAGSVSTIAGLKLRGGDVRGTGTDGGAIFSRGNLTVTGCMIRDNYSAVGGGITTAAAQPNAVLGHSTLSLIDTVITNNTATFGGGIAAVDCQLSTLGYVEVSNNTGLWGGGGIHIDETHENTRPEVLLRGVAINGNTTEQDGAGLLCTAGHVTLDGGSISYNHAVNSDPTVQTHGGGVFVGIKGVVTAENVPTIGFNMAKQGDGMYIDVGGRDMGQFNYIDDTRYDANPA